MKLRHNYQRKEEYTENPIPSTLPEEIQGKVILFPENQSCNLEKIQSLVEEIFFEEAGN